MLITGRAGELLLEAGAVEARALEHDDGVEGVGEAGRRLLADVDRARCRAAAR